jgi:CheY-like chemotaxis protein
VEVAGSADEAIQKVRDWNPTLIVSDVGMPERDGYEFIRDVRTWEAGSNASPTPSIALTAYAAPADRTRALAAGFTSHVAKPVEPIELARIAGNLLDGHKEKEL